MNHSVYKALLLSLNVVAYSAYWDRLQGRIHMMFPKRKIKRVHDKKSTITTLQTDRMLIDVYVTQRQGMYYVEISFVGGFSFVVNRNIHPEGFVLAQV